MDEMGRVCDVYMGEEECIQGLMGKPEGKSSRGRPSQRLDDTVTMDFKKDDRAGTEFIWLEIRINIMLM
jgi:hypothetical protein